MIYIIKETITTGYNSELASKGVTNIKAFLHEEEASDYLDIITQDYRDNETCEIVRDEDDHFEASFEDAERCEVTYVVFEIDRVRFGAGE